MTMAFDTSPSHPGHVHLASTAHDFAVIGRLWRTVYQEELGWIDGSVSAELDSLHHQNADYCLATNDGGAGMGTMRVLFGPRASIPTFKLTHVELPETMAGAQFAEFGRLMVFDKSRKRRLHGYPFGVFAALLQFAIRRCADRNVRFVATNVQCSGEALSLVGALKMAGFEETGTRFFDEFSPLNPPCTALLLDIEDNRARSQCRNPLAAYLYGDHRASEHVRI